MFGGIVLCRGTEGCAADLGATPGGGGPGLEMGDGPGKLAGGGIFEAAKGGFWPGGGGLTWPTKGEEDGGEICL